MSAINPASFASPTLGIQAPSGVGPGAVGVNRSSNSHDRRHNMHHQEQPQQSQASFAMRAQAGRGFQPNLAHAPFGSDKNTMTAQAYHGLGYGYGQSGGINTNPSLSSFGQAIGPGIDSISNVGYQQLGDFQPIRHRYAVAQGIPSPNPRTQGLQPLTQQNDWAALQGLSLNSQ